jgi:deoxyribodipyrimidine photo-lyase
MTSTTGNTPASVIVWFRDDLRLGDHAPLTAALRCGLPVLFCYVLDDEPGAGGLGAAKRWWLHASLASLERQIQTRGGALVFRRGDPAEQIADLARESAAVAVHCHRSYEPIGRRREQALEARLRSGDVEITAHPGRLLFEPEAIATTAGAPFKVFTPFWRACLGAPDPPPELPVPDAAAFRQRGRPARNVSSLRLTDLELLPRGPDWSDGLAATWRPGELRARERLERFVAASVARYPQTRDRPDVDGTSRLSPHLGFGEISARAVWHRVRAQTAADATAVRGADAFLRELLWREFSSHLLWHFPSISDRSFREVFDVFPWNDDRAGVEAWQRGATGFPIVDAGMRELWHTGWMHNRVRMVVASFLVKDLLIRWQSGAEWFADTLVDADPASNAVNWQWVAGSGVDAAPYFRVFNPVLQGKKFDPDGDYVRRWVPELAELPTRYVHAPQTAPPAALAAAGVRLDGNYPRPMLDHAAARQRALMAYGAMTGKL